ncbi:MAG TPA: cyclopropane-fatty-acyl-phospholipid synthase family protein [Streptosporangiaceae bacterium]|nr:cyclopropane-fatty-acyl-phospholipid synthase family protein [Streptosporangiaceae bacterium]
MSAPKGAAEVIAALLGQAGLDLPVRLRAWDGSEAGPLEPVDSSRAPVLVARSPRALQRILWRPGELGLARAYVSGDLDVEGDLTDGLRRVHATAPRSGPFGLIKTVPAAVAAAARLGLFTPPPGPPGCELRVRGRRHSRARDQAVIAGHYDVPSAFYQLILDPSMAYSCAYWDGQRDLTGAQQAKLDLIGRKLALAPGQALLDMGCGWGSLTIHAARARVQVTGVTLSREQGGYVRRRARGLGLNPEVRIQDYRDPLDGTYDAIASVEMGEHVGAARYPAFCDALYGRLRPGGRLLIQQMSRTTRRGGGPFIESYIAPDMDMRPVGETIRLIQDAGFEVIGVEAMREHYARTIRAWLENFEANLPAITTILTAEQVRVWRLYLAGGALAFEQGRMGVDQILAVKPEGSRR